MGIFSEATQANHCWACKGKQGVSYPAGSDDAMGRIRITLEQQPCGQCQGTGLPSEDQRNKARAEEAGLCAECSLNPREHLGQSWPYGCLRAAIAEIHRLTARTQAVPSGK